LHKSDAFSVLKSEKEEKISQRLEECEMLSTKRRFGNRIDDLNTSNISTLNCFLPEIVSFVKNIKKTGLISEEGQHIYKVHSALNILIKEEYEKSKRKYVIEMNGLTKLMASFTMKLIEIEKAISVKNAKPETRKRYYNMIAGYNDLDEKGKFEIKRDIFGNIAGSAYDLSPNFAFSGETIAILQLYIQEGFDLSYTRCALERKGFSLKIWSNIVPTVEEFKQTLDISCQLWIISDLRVRLNLDLLEEIKTFFEKGKGIYIWGDNDPYYADANLIFKYLFEGEQDIMYGNAVGTKTVGLQAEYKKAGVKQNHLITTGISKLYEGNTIATIAKHPQLEPLVYGTENNVTIAVYDKNGKRAILDTGFTKLFNEFWDSVGTARYVVNAASWLVNVERNKI
jgi:hypothetical protein